MRKKATVRDWISAREGLDVIAAETVTGAFGDEALDGDAFGGGGVAEGEGVAVVEDNVGIAMGEEDRRAAGPEELSGG